MAQNKYHARQNMMISKLAAAMICNLRILIFGCGAAANEIVKNLVLMGFRFITVVDFDFVEDSNLSKSVLFGRKDIGRFKAEVVAEKAALMALAENVVIRYIVGNLITDVGKGVFLEHDFVICCVDTKDARVYINDMCVRTHTPFMEVGFRGYNSEVSFFAPEGPIQQQDGTLIDSLPTSDGFFPKMLGTFPVCLREEMGTGTFDGTRNSCSGFKVHDKDLAKIPTIQTGAAFVGAILAQELVKYLDGKDTLRGKMLLFHGLTLETMLIGYTRRPDCTVHDEEYNVVTVPVSREATIGQALQAVEAELGGRAILSLPDDFILSATCHCCGERMQINTRAREVWDEQRWCTRCRETYPDYANRLRYPAGIEKVPREVSLNYPPEVLARKLAETGVPENDILECTVLSGGAPRYYQVYLKTAQE